MVTDFKVTLNRPPQQLFFPGSEVSGTVLFQINEPKDYKYVRVAVCGYAHVHWTPPPLEEGERSTYEQGTYYVAHREYVNLQSIVWCKDQSPEQTLHIGQHSFPFQFSLPNRLPASFGVPTADGCIRYFVEARISTGWLQYDQIAVAEFPVVEIVDINIPQLQAPVSDTAEETICCWYCASGPISLTVETPRSGYCIGEVIPVTINIQNRSRRETKASVTLRQRVVYTARERHPVKIHDFLKILSGPIPPRNPSVWSPGEGLKIPLTTIPSLLSCDIIEVSYFLMVSVVLPVPWAEDVYVGLPLRIGNTPLRDPYPSAPPPVIPPYSQPPGVELTSWQRSQPPAPTPIVGWTPSISHRGETTPLQTAATWNREEPPPYDAVVSNTTIF